MHSISNTHKYAWLMVNFLIRIADLKTYSNPEFTSFIKVKPGTAHLV